jgi:hypothetical protein
MDWVADMLVDSNLTVSHVDATIEGKPDKVVRRAEFCLHFCGASW